jgi:alpha-galactosidase
MKGQQSVELLRGGAAMSRPSRPRWLPVGVAIFTFALPNVLRGEVNYDASNQIWTLRSGAVEYRLRAQEGSVYLDFLGAVGQPSWKGAPGAAALPRPEGLRDEITGLVEGQGISPEDLVLFSHEVRQPQTGVDELRLLLRHRRLPLEIEARYTTWGATGVLTRQLTVTNRGERVLHVDSLPSLAWRLPAGEYELSYLWGAWGHERQLATEHLQAGRRAFVSSRGRSTNGYSPWFSLHNAELGTRYMAQLAYSGNWQMRFEREPGPHPLRDGDLRADLGMRFDFGGTLALPPGESFSLPLVAFTATPGNLDDAANQLHRFQRQYVIPRTATNDPLRVQFNSWYPFPGKIAVEELKRCADIAAELGAEVFVLDAGWFNKRDWSRELGDWQADRIAFPNGIEELANYVRSKGLKFGIWVEIENLGVESQTFKEHPDWVLTYNGQPLKVYDRYHLNFAKPEVRRWARAVVDRLAKDYQIEWLKIDYNTDIGERFDPPGADRPGDVLYRHLMNYYSWLDEVRAAHPTLNIENCSSGGTRFDLGIMAHTHTTWLSDEVRPIPSVQLGYGCTVEFPPEVCNHWMVGDKDNGEVLLSNPPGWWDFMFRVPMNGQYGISSRVFDWSPELRQHARDAVALYKRLRQVIIGADVYHLTPPPAHYDPTGWSAVQYVSVDGKRSVLMAYRLAKSTASQVFQLRGLAAEGKYRVSEEGKTRGSMAGRQLVSQGLPVKLDAEWRAAVFELQEEP